MAEDQSSAEFELQDVYALNRICCVGTEVKEDSALLQLRFNAKAGGGASNDGRMAFTVNWALGKILWKTSDAEAAGVVCKGDSCLNA